MNTSARTRRKARCRCASNYFFCALAGVTWYFQFFFYTMGETQMGKYKFSSWTLHMASIIIFSSLWGIALHEWRGASGAHQELALRQPGGAGSFHHGGGLRQLRGDTACERMIW